MSNDARRLLRGHPDKPVFLFLHGLGTIDDLQPLARCFNREGYTCELLLLKGHDGVTGEMGDTAYSEWIEQLGQACEIHRKEGRSIFLVGFSLGGLLALDFAARRSCVAGILAISSFLAPALPALTSTLIRFAKLRKDRRLKRRLQATHKDTKNQLTSSNYLPVKALEAAIAQGKRVQESACQIRCPVLFIHSLHDRVASYEALLRTVRNLDIERYQVVTLHHLNHFLQFDVPSWTIFDLTVEFFRLADGDTTSTYSDRPALIEALRQAYDESRHWAGILFQLVIGFLSAFGVLLYFSLSEVLSREDEAPYYVLAYTLIINFYLLLSFMYLFYLTRTLVYTKYHLEPRLIEFPWTAYKTIPWAAGRISEKMTRGVFLSIAILPGITSFVLMVYCLVSYPDRFLVIDEENNVLQAVFAASAFLWFQAARSFVSLRRYIHEMLYWTAHPMRATPRFQELLFQLYARVSPGCVRRERPEQTQEGLPDDQGL
jgi:esterase/lipase